MHISAFCRYFKFPQHSLQWNLLAPIKWCMSFISISLVQTCLMTPYLKINTQINKWNLWLNRTWMFTRGIFPESGIPILWYRFQKHKFQGWGIMGSAAPKPFLICQKIKRFSKLIKEKNFLMSFQLLPLEISFKAKSAVEAAFLGSLRFFRHQYQWHSIIYVAMATMAIWPLWPY